MWGEGEQERQWKVGAGLSQEEPPRALRSQDLLSESQGLGRPQALRLPALSGCGVRRGGPPPQSCWQAVLWRGGKAILKVGNRSSYK